MLGEKMEEEEEEEEQEEQELSDDVERRSTTHLDKYKFKKGQSGNPTGSSSLQGVRGKFQTRIRSKARGGQVIVDFLFEIMRNEVFDRTTAHARGKKLKQKQVSIKDRLAAAKLLTEYGWGKPTLELGVRQNPKGQANGGPQVVILNLTPEQVVAGEFQREAEALEATNLLATENYGGRGPTQISPESLPVEHLAGDGLGLPKSDRPLASPSGEGQDRI